MKLGQKYRSKDGVIGSLEITLRERSTDYRWTQCLALLCANGGWLYTGYWKSNGFKTADRELRGIGFERID